MSSIFTTKNGQLFFPLGLPTRSRGSRWWFESTTGADHLAGQVDPVAYNGSQNLANGEFMVKIHDEFMVDYMVTWWLLDC